ncbi:MAG: retropepsin-like aspartic protease [Aquidulcibacter sp.]|jgi:predicted aspartyl protease|uniref:retropepsin-like aspartic protease family protein n=1 Tax=Aquidulcibacter sp. TaxID=2052990 RepID=UPI0022BA802A|nr:retropepsin-like aspartic protease [Aquidulcibacter sp.]MCE2890472.1 retroviral-like aspartic protease family protein [Hyphomonadaceae bacterium]MCZ8206774.1 retropepsin-like aspartic protease [Aquidulcibacter sp.]
MALQRRDLVTSLLGFGLAGPAWAQKATPAATETVTVTGQTPIVTLQTWIDLYGRPTAEVKLNGKGPFKFVVDTGSNTSVLSPRVARALELPELPMRTVHGVTGSSQAHFAKVGQIETGRSVSNNLTVAIIDAPALDNLDGILGMDMFANRRVRFNFSRKTVDLEPASSRRLRKLPISVGVKLRHGLLIEAEGRVGGLRSKCILDTGGDTTIINMAMLNALSARARRRTRPEEAPIILGVTNQQLNGVWANLPEFNLIGLNIRRLTVVAADAPVFKLWGLESTPAMLVGMDILSQVETLVVDYRRREVELQLLSSLVGGEHNIYRG